LGKILPFNTEPTDQEKFDLLVRPHFDDLYVSAVRLTRSEADAEDLLQDVLLKSLRWLEELEQVEFPRAWLVKVMYNTFIDQTRSQQRSPLSEANDAVCDPDELPAHDEPLARLLDRQRRVERVLHAMRYLNREDCALLGMREVEGLTIKELRQVTGMPEGTIKARLHRARKRLGRLLSKDAVAAPHLRIVGGNDEL